MARESYYLDGVRLRELRNAKHLTSEQAAVKIGLSDKTLRSYETLDKAGLWSNVQKLARFYRVDPEALVITVEQRRPESVAAERAAAAAKRSREENEKAQ